MWRSLEPGGSGSYRAKHSYRPPQSVSAKQARVAGQPGGTGGTPQSHGAAKAVRKLRPCPARPAQQPQEEQDGTFQHVLRVAAAGLEAEVLLGLPAIQRSLRRKLSTQDVTRLHQIQLLRQQPGEELGRGLWIKVTINGFN